MSVYKSTGKTGEEAFFGIWQLMQHTDDYLLRKTREGFEIRLKVSKPTRKEREEFEDGKV